MPPKLFQITPGEIMSRACLPQHIFPIPLIYTNQKLKDSSASSQSQNLQALEAQGYPAGKEEGAVPGRQGAPLATTGPPACPPHACAHRDELQAFEALEVSCGWDNKAWSIRRNRENGEPMGQDVKHPLLHCSSSSLQLYLALRFLRHKMEKGLRAV